MTVYTPLSRTLKLALATICTALFLALSFQAPQARAVEATEKVILAVENMTCALCPFTVRKSLQRVDGVIDAQVDFASKTATVIFNPAKTGVKALTQATTQAGYPSTLKE